MSVAELIRNMAAAGAPIDAIVLAVEAIEARDIQAAEKRAKVADRKRRQRERERDCHVTVTGQGCDIEADKEKSPQTPLKEIYPPSPKGDSPPIGFPENPANDIDEPLRPDHVVEAWNETAAQLGLPKVARLTPQRRKRLRTMIAEHPPDDFQAALDAVASSPFCRGENDRGWKADFDFFIQPKSFTKLMEGAYG